MLFLQVCENKLLTLIKYEGFFIVFVKNIENSTDSLRLLFFQIWTLLLLSKSVDDSDKILEKSMNRSDLIVEFK